MIETLPETEREVINILVACGMQTQACPCVCAWTRRHWDEIAN
jgi:hypothetical protein